MNPTKLICSPDSGNTYYFRSYIPTDLIEHFDGVRQIDRRGEREGLPKEILFENEQELLKRIHEIKKELKESEWSEIPPPKVTQPSFLRTDLGEGKLSCYFV